MRVVDKYTLAVILIGCCLYDVVLSSDMEKYFPSIQGNLSAIVWAHAVNNQSYLKETLNNSVINMIEADISLGYLDNQQEEVPIMAHPPINHSDLSLENFLTMVTQFNNNLTNVLEKKGVKLDFKTIDVFEKSVEIVKKYTKESFPIWLNADILPGPINSTTLPVNSTTFLEKAKMFPESILSIGWTTNYTSDGAQGNGSYSEKQINEMVEVIRSNNVTQNVTFAVRAGLAAASFENMRKLWSSVPNSTLTIWQSGNDTVDIEKLRRLIATCGLNRTYIDVPEDLMNHLKLNELPTINQGITHYVPSLLLLFTCMLTILS